MLGRVLEAVRPLVAVKLRGGGEGGGGGGGKGEGEGGRGVGGTGRSEEGRVGEEGRSRGAADH